MRTCSPLFCSPAIALPFSLSLLATAAVANESDAQNVEIIEVTSARLARELYETPGAMSVVNVENEIQLQEALQLDEALQFVPGVYFQNRYNFAQNLRISIRGFGSRAAFGVRGLQLQVDGIPFTLPDGQTQVDGIDMNAVNQIQVIRGAASVQYGNGAGGAIDVVTQSGETLQGVKLNVDVGSDDFYKVNLQAGGSSESASGFVSVSHLDFAGSREQSAVQKSTLSGKFSYRFDDERSVTLLTSLMDMPTSEDPGGLTAAQVAEDRQQAAYMAKLLDAGQQVEQQTVGVVYRDESLANGYWSANTFVSWRDFTQQLPFPGSSLIKYDRVFFGGGLQLSQDWQADNIPVRYTAGTEFRRQRDDRTRFGVSSDNLVTGQTADEEQTADSASVFVIADWLASDRLIVSLGGRYDSLKMTIDDALGLGDVGSGERKYSQLNGSVGISYRFSEQHQGYANVATAYESPTFTEFANPQGTGFNPELSPQDTISRELGLRGGFADLSYDVALFSIRVTDELIAYEIDGRTFYENAGATNREGLEAAIQWQMNQQWQWRSALTLADYEFDDFVSVSEEDIAGKQMPGLPQTQWVNQLNWHNDQWRVELEGTYNGSVYAENSNTTEIDSYWLVNGRVGYRFSEHLALQVGVRNVFDEAYFANVRINANSDREVDARGYFEPAPGRNYYLGIKADF
ncbi:TonB-dependent receptor [Alteromonas sp. C1M14]|uniref:TonB-dependent receptor family protein n=1 Tax=Alteromonas sp. C1M14 TaxID=2841567 RepID=UPI001C0834DA|nr:TonB-dependent receptor [Alteromonas sp. C1M14]MBU2978487.1 TonB-dependent receptor [Alteromonas sp. C1M14]